MFNKALKRKIIVRRDSDDPVVLDCPVCELSLRDWEDFFSTKVYGMCNDCKTNHTKENRKDN